MGLLSPELCTSSQLRVSSVQGHSTGRNCRVALWHPYLGSTTFSLQMTTSPMHWDSKLVQTKEQQAGD